MPTAGHVWIEGAKLHYIDADGVERSIPVENLNTPSYASSGKDAGSPTLDTPSYTSVIT